MSATTSADVELSVPNKVRRLEASATREFDALHRHDATLRNYAPARLEVFIMTFTGATTGRDLLPPGNSLLEDMAGKGGFVVKPPNRKRKAVPRPFDNQITLRYGGNNGTEFCKAVKIFNNGALHVVGCKSAAEYERVSGAACEQLAAATGKDVRATDMRLQMLNINLYVPAGINLAKMRNLMLPCMGLGGLVSVDYTPDRFPGLKCKVLSGGETPKAISILVYGGGCVRMCGLQSYEQARAPYEFVTSFIDEHFDVLGLSRAPANKLNS